jgi:hypothetical protein
VLLAGPRRKLELYLLSGHQHEQPIDYPALFQYLAEIPAQSRTRLLYDRMIALGEVGIYDDLVKIIAYEGSEREFPLIYNRTSALERFETLSAGEILARKTRALLDLVTREMAIEYNHRGAKAVDIVNLCQYLARQDRRWDALDLTVVPVPQRTFLDAIDRFSVIKSATIKVVEPNQDWTRDYKNLLSQMSDDSGAGSGDITLHARRKGTLSKTRGIIAYLRDLAFGRAASAVEGATVTGIREGETAESSVSLKKHVESRTVTPRLLPSGQVDEGDVEIKLREYLDSRRGNRD